MAAAINWARSPVYGDVAADAGTAPGVAGIHAINSLSSYCMCGPSTS